MDMYILLDLLSKENYITQIGSVKLFFCLRYIPLTQSKKYSMTAILSYDLSLTNTKIREVLPMP